MTATHASPTPPVELRPATGRYVELTSVRGIAALAVIATHAAYWTGQYGSSRWALAWARLDFGVALFFVLSGFLLFRGWVAALYRGGPQPSVTAYLRKRALRILPGYWVAVIAAYTLVGSDIGRGGESFLRSMTLTQAYGGQHQHLGLTQMWSLTVEVAFYLLLPLVALFACRVVCGGQWRPIRLLVTAAAFGCVSVVWYALTREVWTLDFSSIYWLPGYTSWFAVGMGLAVVAVTVESSTDPPHTAVRAVVSSPGATWVLALALMVIASTPVAGAATLVPLPLFDALAKNLLYAVCAGLFIAPLVLGATGTPATRWLRWGPLLWLGDISYEVFLVHLIVIEAVLHVMGYANFTGSVGYVFVLTATASVVLAWLLKRTVDAGVNRLRFRR